MSRRYDITDDWTVNKPQPGDYWKAPDGTWECMTPNGLYGSLLQHEVVEHEDGTVTVSPSILVIRSDITYHGYLRNGEWSNA